MNGERKPRRRTDGPRSGGGESSDVYRRGFLYFLSTLLLATPTLAPAQTSTPAEPEILIRAVRGKCRVQLADRLLSDRELAIRSTEWAALGVPVRVVAPAGRGYKCLARIAFRLNEKGVRLIHFIDREDVPAQDPAS